jgi:hypothetical protein
MLLMPGSLNGDPKLLAALPGVFGSRDWQDWLGFPVPGGFAAEAGEATASTLKVRATRTDAEIRRIIEITSGYKSVPAKIRE